MKLITCTTLLILSMALPRVFSATVTGLFYNPANPGKCTIQDDMVLKPGERIKDPNHPCAMIICREGSYADFHTCSTSSHYGCENGNYINSCAPYPECCERQLICN